MLHWLSGLAQFGADVARREVKRLVAMMIFIGLAVLCVILALGFFLAGLFVALEQSLGPVAACFIMFGGLLFIALTFFLLASAPGRRRRRRDDFDEELALAGEERPGVAGVAAAFAFGLARGFSRRRKT
jgi:type VI protein secretion system component VasK